MNDIEIRLRCVEAAVHVPGNPNTLQQAREFYGFAVEGRQEPSVEGDIADVVTIISPTETPFMKEGAGALLRVAEAPAPKGKGQRK
jgi:hypothetical protein